MADLAGRHGGHSPPGSGSEAVAARDALHRLHLAAQSVHLPQHASGLDLVREERDHLLRLLETYTLPRLARRQAPLVVVIGGPTGAGKSTLTNSLVGTRVTYSGLMRPTTREPVMAYNPVDADALRELGLLDAETGENRGSPTRPESLQAIRPRPVPNRDIVPGLTLIDSPDLDSRLDSNRRLADRLLTAADLWIFVSTGTDYADAMSWTLLNEAARRDISVAVVLNRLRDRESATVQRHFAVLLRDAGLAHAYMFALPETRLVDDRLPLQLVLTMQKWLEKQARSSTEREVHRTRAWEGTIDQVVLSARRLADAIDDQVVDARRRRVDVEGVFSTAREAIRDRCSSGALVSQDLLEAWEELHAEPVASSSGAFRRRPQPVTTPDVHRHPAIAQTLCGGLVSLLYEQVELAVFRSSQRLDIADDLRDPSVTAQLSEGFAERANAATYIWLNGVHHQVHGDQADSRDPEHDPVTLAIATSAILARSGHRTAPSGAVLAGSAGLNHHGPPDTADEAELDRRVRALLERHLTEYGRPADVEDLARDAWLDLVMSLSVVVSQEETHQIRAFEAVPIPDETAGQLREHADEVAGLRSAGRLEEPGTDPHGSS